MEKIFNWHNLGYEFLGTLLITTSYNLNKQFTLMMTIVSIWSWNLSSAHFNPAFSLGSMIVHSTNIESFKYNLINLAMTFVAQICGAMCAIGVVFGSSQVLEKNNHRDIMPAVPSVCPAMGVQGCSTDKLHFRLFVVELVVSTALIFSFLIIRYSKMPHQKWMMIVGPILIAQVYLQCQLVTSTTTASTLNPMIALETLIWSSVGYNNKSYDPNQTDFKFLDMGRYWWLYVVAPMIAAVPAGFLAKLHLRNDTQIDQKQQVFSEN
jgi:glycerol uptake facilitator-like aquaporin